MAMNINVPLFVFALMIQSLLYSLFLIGGLPPALTAAFGTTYNPTAYLGYDDPDHNFGIAMIASATGCDEECAGDWLCVISNWMCVLGGYIIGLANMGIMIMNVILFLLSFLYSMITFLLLSGFSVMGALPNWIGVPIGIFLTILNVIIIANIAIVIRSLL